MVKHLYILAAATLALADPTVYLIRHGEKPDDGDGLNAQGEQRAQCLRNVFGASSSYNIGHIMAQTPKSGTTIQHWDSSDLLCFELMLIRTDGGRQRPLDTVEPLASDLGLTVDTSCDRDDSKCVEDVVKDYDGSGNILICWEHDALTDIIKKLGDDDAPDYPDDSFNIIWTDPSPYDSITSETSEDCPGLDS
ncbi:hypothetical protein N7532_000988 [Penicillium argentinense]|uniref:Phosphoglycerate mutase family protein n=1 Tax=Penicillium argentinense TaxID=1131581 RepID=A0A9W9G1N9_9EURO|nr:uncharacterized protein N7532_000988 [Penicillium argentinense]KAJ5110453.1 hypothetical protein N7532_000988 [Penicillium argentinense]